MENSIPKEVIDIFKSEKTEDNGWFTTNLRGEKNWNKNKVGLFWSFIRKYKTENNDFEFTEYIFPSFETELRSNINNPLSKDLNFWKKGETKVFNKAAYFNDAKFLDIANFEYVTFNSSVNFIYSEFLSQVKFNFSIFKHQSCFSRSIFNGHVFFAHSQFIEETIFYGTTFLSEVYFHKTIFSDTLFQKIIIGTEEILFESIVVPDKTICFKDLNIKHSLVFRRCDMDSIVFFRCDVKNITFLSCNWNKGNRIIFKLESFLNYKPGQTHTLRSRILSK